MTPNLRLDVPRFLARLPLFASIDEATLGWLAARCELRRLNRGEFVFQAGGPAEAFFVVVGGQIRLFVSAPNGQEKVVQIFGPGQSFAEAVMFLGVPAPLSAQALSEAIVLNVPREAVLEEITRDSQFALRMLAGLSRRLHGLVQDVEAYSLRNGVQRVIGYLLNERHVPGQSPGAAPTVSLPVSKGTLASRLSLTPEYFSRVLRELEEAGLIEVDKRDIRILDADKLAAYEG